jgi:nitrous oxidase accessory protein
MVVEGGDTANRNDWRGNSWDDYEGFDRDGDGVGDTPHELYAYADRLWMDVPPAQFFKGSPMLEVLDFLERLAPFSPPQLLARDERPRVVTLAPLDRDGSGPVSTEASSPLSPASPSSGNDPDRVPDVADDAGPPSGETTGFNALEALRSSLERGE